MDNLKLKNAYGIAIKNLRACYGPNGIYSGLSHFKDYWARDSLFSCLACLKLKDYEIVKRQLRYFLKFKSHNGQLPLRIGDYNIILKLLGLRGKGRTDRARYNLDQLFYSVPKDQNSLYVIIFYQYIKQTNDINFLNENFNSLVKIINWNLSNCDKDFLIKEGLFENWQDSVIKKGKTLYTNACHLKALSCFYELSKIVNYPDKVLVKKIFSKAKSNFEKKFWNNDHYRDYTGDNKFFSVDGNLLVCYFGLTSSSKSIAIQNYLKNYLGKGLLNNVYPPYPFYMISPIILLLGMKDYHRKFNWLWVNCLASFVLAKHNKEKALELLDNVAGIVCDYKNFYEIYFNNKPVKRLLYRSEVPFAWSSAFYILTYDKIINDRLINF